MFSLVWNKSLRVLVQPDVTFLATVSLEEFDPDVHQPVVVRG